MRHPAKKLVYFDCTRLLRKLKSKNPTGIERTDIEYLRAIFMKSDEFEIHGIFEVLNRGTGLNYLVHIEHDLLRRMMNFCYTRWIGRGAEVANDDELAERLLTEAVAEVKGVALKPDTRVDKRIFKNCSRHAGRAVYLNCSFVTIPDGVLHEEQMRQVPIRTCYVVYDLVPIEFPEYMWNDTVAKNHLETLTAIARGGAKLIAISDYVREQIESLLSGLDVPCSNLAVAPCGVGDLFLKMRIADAADYKPENKFTIFCTIEPRKNHVLLLNIWREMINQGAPEIPRLSIIGRRGWSNETTFRFLDKSPALREYVTEYNNLGDEDMVKEILSSKATLYPSFGEGWGLPIVESLTLGVPAICSDLKVHRECSQGHAEYLHPLDGLGWMNRIKQISNGDWGDDISRQHATRAFTPITWDQSSANIVEIVMAT